MHEKNSLCKHTKCAIVPVASHNTSMYFIFTEVYSIKIEKLTSLVCL